MSSPDAVRAMLAARSVAVVGASERSGSFGSRLVTEVTRSPSAPMVYLVNPRYTTVHGRPCVASLDDISHPVDLVLLAVPDQALEAQLRTARDRGDRSAVIFGAAYEPPTEDRATLRERLGRIAGDATMALCGAGCMGFINLSVGLRAIGYLEREHREAGPIALLSHSGSAFSALLRTHRGLGFSLAVSMGQELVTTTADYLDYALELPQTAVVALIVETVQAPDRLRASFDRASRRDVPVVLLAVGDTPGAGRLVTAHSGALAGGDAAWEALSDAHGLLRVADLDEMADVLELLAAGRRAPVTGPGTGIATVHDSGAERALVADIAHRAGVPFADLSAQTTERLAALLDDGLEPANPLDVWGNGAQTRELFAGCLDAVAADPQVAAVVLAVDLVEEYDGDDSYPLAVLDAASRTAKPVVVLCNLTSAIDQQQAAALRAHGVPVLEGTRSGLRALGHLLRLGELRPEAPLFLVDAARRARWQEQLRAGPLSTPDAFALLRDYGIPVVDIEVVNDLAGALAAADRLGWPLVLKTDEAGIAHKSDVRGVRVGLADADAVAVAYADLSRRLGPRVLVSSSASPGTELSLGIVHDALLGPLVVVGAGGVLVELLRDRSVGLPPLDSHAARRLLDRLSCRPLLDGARGAPAADVPSVIAAICAVAQLAFEIGDDLMALDVNPLIVGARGSLGVDVFVEPRPGGEEPVGQKMA